MTALFDIADTFVTAFFKICANSPESTAVDDKGQLYDYATLEKNVKYFRNTLLHKSLPYETPIVVLLPRGFQLVTALFGIMSAGLVYVPLDANHPDDRLYYICKHTEAPFIVTWQEYENRLPAILRTLSCNIIYIEDILAEVHATVASEADLPKISLNTLAYIIYTSGSTGEPKGVAVEHRGICNFIAAQIDAFKVTPHSRLLQFLPICFDASISEIGVALLAGAQLCFLSMDEYADKSLASKIFTIIEQKQFNIACIPPAFLPFLPIDSTPSCLQTVIIGGEVCSAKEIDRWRKKVRLVNVYGPTEATVCTSLQIYEPEGNFESTSIGTPIPNTELFVLDEDMKSIEEGELFIKGLGVARGYFKDEILTAAKFIRHDGKLMYKTGDRVLKKNNGDILFLGRVDDQVKLRGQRIELQEIENQLLHYPSIKQAKVILTDEAENSHLVAFLAVEKMQVFSEKATKEFLATKVPYYMVPSEFIALDELSRNNNEKIDRKKLKEIYSQRKIDGRRHEISSKREILIKIIAELVHSDVGEDDNLFDLGINSITIVQLIQQAKQNGVDLTLNDILMNKTIRDLTQMAVKMDQPATLAVSVKDLLPDCILQLPANIAKVGPSSHKNILLTGATGFLGSYLLLELINQTKSQDVNITCVVRSINAEEQIRTKIGSDKFSVMVGDFSLPYLGLSPEEYEKLSGSVDTVYHCGGNVNVILPYDILKKTNVTGTRNIIEFCLTNKSKTLHYISTLSVFTSTNTSKTVIEETDKITYNLPSEIYGGYASSKWVSEYLVETAIKQGLQAVIYRPGLVSNHSITGDYANDWLARLLRQCSAMKLRPDFDTCQTDVTPIDYVSKSIVALSLVQATNIQQQIYHLANKQHIFMNELFELYKSDCNYEWKIIPFSEWQSELKKTNHNHLGELLPLFTSLSFDELESLLFPAQKFEFKCSYFDCPPPSIDILGPFFSLLMSCRNKK